MNPFTFDKSRVLNFSDAVFSIAMTLLVLDIAIPTAKLYQKGFGAAFSDMVPGLIGFLVSFLVIAMYWVAHLKLTRFLSSLDAKFLYLNIFLLLFVVLLPFSTDLYVTGYTLTGPFVFYSLNLGVIGIFLFFMTRYVYQKEKGKTGFTSLIYHWYQWRGLTVVAIWLIAAVIAAVLPNTARMIFLAIFLVNAILDRVYKKRIKATQKY